jgi:putative endonuclease
MRVLNLLFTWWKRFREPLSFGRRGEREAERYLKRQGFIILARGNRARLGEIDLVAVEKRTIVFVEVKTRTSHDAGHPAEAVDRHKQRRLTRAAREYLKRHQLTEYPARFDVVAVTWPDARRRPVIEHIRNAFEAVD